MGAFCTSLHVRGTAEAVAQAFTSDGELKLAPGGGDADVEVLAATENGWTSLFDASFDQNQEALDELAARLSGALATVAIGVLVHDSDVLMLRLYERGKLVDAYNSQPDYFGEELGASARKAAAGHATRWKNALATGAKVAELRALMKGAPEQTIAEEALDDFGRLVGIAPELLANSADYLREPEQADLRGRMQTLRFVRTRREPTTPLRLQVDPNSLKVEALNGGADGNHDVGAVIVSTQTSFVVQDGRGLTDGFDLELGGPLLERGLVETTRDASVLAFFRGGMKSSRDVPWKRIGPALLRATFPRSALPAPHKVVPKGWPEGLGMSIQPAFSVRSLAAGEGELVLRFIPRQQPDAAVARAYRLRFVPPATTAFPRLAAAPRRPERALHQLRYPRVLSAMLVLRATREAILPLSERFLALLGPSDRFTVVADSAPEEVPPGRIEARWHTAAASAKKLALLVHGGAGAKPPRIGDPLVARADGTSIGAPGEGLVAAGLWFHERNAVAELVQLLDQAATLEGFQQGFIARWDWTPTMGVVGGLTPYEECAGLRQEPLSPPPPHPDLRAVTPWLWLGPALVQRLPAEALAECAEVTAVGASQRVLLREGHALEELEAALAPIVPGRERFTAG